MAHNVRFGTRMFGNDLDPDFVAADDHVVVLAVSSSLEET
jgi:hypothetical protein